jgi:nucleoside-diphosphate-sugar epimerase
MARILIAGCGDVGGLLAVRLRADGHAVFGLRRDASRVPAGVTAVAADLAEPSTLAGLPGPFDAVVYTATPGASSDAGYERAYVAGQRNLAAALSARFALPGRWLFASSTAVYGHSAGEWVDEASATEPAGFSGRRLLEAEALVASLGVARPIAVRFGGIYGPGRTWLVERVRAGAPCAAGPPIYTNRIHREDCAGVLAHLLALPDPESCYLGVDSNPAAQCEVMDWIAERIGAPRPAREATGGSRGSKRCRNARLLATGYRMRYRGYRDGYAALLAG